MIFKFLSLGRVNLYARKEETVKHRLYNISVAGLTLPSFVFWRRQNGS